MSLELRALYETYWNDLVYNLDLYNSEGTAVKPTHPFLIDLDEKEFRDADIRIMVFGQETNDWYGEWSNKGMDEVLKMYSDFFCSGDCYKYGKPFFNAISDYLKAVYEKYPDKKVSCVWNNILKIGKAGDRGRPPKEILDLENKYFPVVREEIKILNPNIEIFFTGPYYDEFLHTRLETSSLEEVDSMDTWKLARIVSEALPEKTFRTYHPGYLRRAKIYHTIKESILFQL